MCPDSEVQDKRCSLSSENTNLIWLHTFYSGYINKMTERIFQWVERLLVEFSVNLISSFLRIKWRKCIFWKNIKLVSDCWKTANTAQNIDKCNHHDINIQQHDMGKKKNAPHSSKPNVFQVLVKTQNNLTPPNQSSSNPCGRVKYLIWSQVKLPFSFCHMIKLSSCDHWLKLKKGGELPLTL